MFGLRCELPTRCLAKYSSSNREAIYKNTMFLELNLRSYLDLYKDELLAGIHWILTKP